MITQQQTNSLFNDNVLLAYHIVNKYYANLYNWPRFVDIEDIQQHALIGLNKAANTYDNNRGIKFTTFAGKCIDNEIKMFHRYVKRHIDELHYDDEAQINNNETIPYIEMLPDNSIDIDETISIKDAISKLSSKEKIIMKYLIAGMNQIEIGNKLGNSQSYTSRLIKQIEYKFSQAGDPTMFKECNADCPDRQVGCHDKCDKYARDVERFKRNRQAKQTFFANNIGKARRVPRALRRKNRPGKCDN